MKIEIVERDRKNGHFDVYINDDRGYAIRGSVGNLFVRHEDKSTLIDYNFGTVEACLIHIFSRLLDRI